MPRECSNCSGRYGFAPPERVELGGLAFTPLATVPVYCATKAGLHAFCVSLRHQLRHTSVKVFGIIPPAVASNLGHTDGYDRSQDQAMDVREFVAEVLHVLAQDQYEVGIGPAEGLRQQREGLFGAPNPWALAAASQFIYPATA